MAWPTSPPRLIAALERTEGMAVERVASEGMGLERVAPERVDRNRKRKREKTCIFKNNNNKNNNNNSNNSRPPKMSHLACLHVSYIQNTKHILLFPHRRLFVDRVPLDQKSVV